MGLEDKYIPIKEVKYKDKKIVLPRTVYIKESYTKGQDKDRVIKGVFDQLIKDPELLFRLMECMCASKEKLLVPISINGYDDTVWRGYIKED